MRKSLPFVVVTVAAIVCGAAPAVAAKLLVFAPAAGPGLTAKEAVVVGDAVAAAASRAGHDVVTQQQLESLVGLEAARQVAGCEAGSCAADLGAALGADAIVNVGLGKIGKSVVVTVKRTDVKGGSGKVADLRLTQQKGALDAALDALPRLVAEALTGLPTTPAATTPAATSAPTTPTTTTLAPTPAWAETKTAAPKKPTWWKDDAGHLVALDADDAARGAVFFGRGNRLFAVRKGEGASMNGANWSRSFWDPRFRDGVERSIDFKDGALSITCGATTTTFTPTTAPSGAAFFAAPFQRVVVLLGRDDNLRYVVVDALREDGRDGPLRDVRVYLGKKGKMQRLDVEAEVEGEAVVAAGPGVKLQLSPAGGALVEGSTTSKLTEIDLWNGAKTVYGDLKPWGETGLGTPCD